MSLRTTALLVAIAVATLAGPPAWGHRFPEVRTIVVQVERCEIALLVGYRPASGAVSDTILAKAASAPRGHALDALKAQLASHALAPITVSLDGAPLAMRSADVKIGVEPGGTRPIAVLLVTYALPEGRALAISSREGGTTRIAWQDQRSQRVALQAAPAQGRWHNGVASFLLELLPTGASTCAPRSASPSSPAR